MQTTINAVLFIPFAVLLAILAIVFLRAGYKKGLWHSLISLGATVISLVLSMLLGKLVGKLLGGAIASVIPDYAFEDMAFSGLVLTAVQTLIQAMMSILFFGLFMVISVIVLKAISKRVHWKKLDEATTNQSKGMRWAGLGVRALDAIVLTVLLLLPLYGSLAALISPVASVAAIAADEDDEAVESLQVVAEHPVVKVYKKGPAAALYHGVAGFEMGGESIDVVKITETMEVLIDYVEQIESADDEEERLEVVSDMASYARENVIEEEWCYQLLCALREELEDMDEIEDDPMAEEIVDLLDMSEEDFQSNGIALLEFFTFALDDDYMEFYEYSDVEELDSEFYEEVGDLINHSKQAVALKKLIITGFAADMFWGYYDYDDAWEEAENFVDAYISDKATKPAKQDQEAEAFMQMIAAYDYEELLNAFASHPDVGYDGARDLENRLDSAREYSARWD